MSIIVYMLLVKSEHTNKQDWIGQSCCTLHCFSFLSLRNVAFVKGSIRILMLIIQTEGLPFYIKFW